LSRDEGFAIADVDTSLYGDTKVARLWRELGDQALMGCAMSLLEATRLTSWREGERVTVEDAAPAWMLDIDKIVAGLVDVGLLDKDHRIPRKSFTKWFGTAKVRRQASRERWRKSKQLHRSSTDVQSSGALGPRGHDVETRAPSVPTVPTESKNGRRTETRERRGSRPTRVGDLLAGELDPSVRAGLALLERRSDDE
jgi:hypothetical protein